MWRKQAHLPWPCCLLPVLRPKYAKNLCAAFGSSCAIFVCFGTSSVLLPPCCNYTIILIELSGKLRPLGSPSGPNRLITGECNGLGLFCIIGPYLWSMASLGAAARMFTKLTVGSSPNAGKTSSKTPPSGGVIFHQRKTIETLPSGRGDSSTPSTWMRSPAQSIESVSPSIITIS